MMIKPFSPLHDIEYAYRTHSDRAAIRAMFKKIDELVREVNNLQKSTTSVLVKRILMI